MPDEERDNAMLTDGQRKFLESDGTGYTHQNAYEYRESIKERVHNTILDFHILLKNWPEEEREEVFDELIDFEDGRKGLIAMIAIFYLETRFSGWFDNLFGQGIRKAEDIMAGGGGALQVSVKPISEVVERTRAADIERAIEKFGKGKLGIRDMSDEEARALVRLLSDYGGWTHADFQKAEEELREDLKAFSERIGEAVETRQEKARDKSN